MTKAEFLDELKNIFEVEELTADQKLADLEEFDSLAVMSIVAMTFSKFKVKLSGANIKKVINANDLIDLIGREKFTD